MGNKFTQKAENALNRSVTIAEELGHTYIGTEHILTALSEDASSCSSVLMKKYKLSYEALTTTIKEYSGSGNKTTLSSRDTTPRCRRVLEISYRIANKFNSVQIGTAHILLALLEEQDSVAFKVLLRMNIDTASFRDDIICYLKSAEKKFGEETTLPDNNILNLLKYGKNLTRIASRGEVDPVIGREKETDRIICILARKSKNNPCLIGEAGVGKTAIIEGLAQRIADGKVPRALLGKTIISLDITSIVAGAKYRGDFEERIKSIMAEAAKNKSVILFIDEIHTIVGAGSAEGAIDAANIMKPELARGDIQVIGATTLTEYRKYIEKDAALERRFQPVVVEETSVDGTIQVLQGIKERYEKHHGIYISDSAISAAAVLSDRYINYRAMPDKAIDVLDEACAKVNLLRAKQKPDHETEMMFCPAELPNAIHHLTVDNANTLSPVRTLTADDIHGVITDMTGIELVSENSARQAQDLYCELSRSVIGQPAAVAALTDAVLYSSSGLRRDHGARGVFLFLGESGVGKTKLAKSLSKALFNTDGALIRYDMSEFSEAYSVSKLIGAAPGYVGYEDSVASLERIRKHPYSVVLFDEIEKAHPDIISLFLQMFDDGSITDAQGRKISFRNCYIIMTSNIGADKFKCDTPIGFNVSGDKQFILRDKLKRYFKEEFINRIDDIILFSQLDCDALTEIAKIHLDDTRNKALALGIELIFSDAVIDHIVKYGAHPGFGARAIERYITQNIDIRLAKVIQQHQNTKSIFEIAVLDGKIEISEHERVLSS